MLQRELTAVYTFAVWADEHGHTCRKICANDAQTLETTPSTAAPNFYLKRCLIRQDECKHLGQCKIFII